MMSYDFHHKISVGQQCPRFSVTVTFSVALLCSPSKQLNVQVANIRTFSHHTYNDIYDIDIFFKYNIITFF